MKINGVEAKDYRIIVPKDSPIAIYAANLIRRQMALTLGIVLDIVDDTHDVEEHEILIGNTSRTTFFAKKGEYLIRVTEKGIEANCYYGMGYEKIVRCFEFIFNSKRNGNLTDGMQYKGYDGTSPAIEKCGQIRMIWHNIWGNSDGAPWGMRGNLNIDIYRDYAPDIIGFQEYSPFFRESGDSKKLMEWLSREYEEFYVLEEYKAGMHVPIFYKRDKFEVLDSGFIVTTRSDKGTTWLVLRTTDENKNTFCITNSHFRTDANLANHDEANQYRMWFAATVVKINKDVEQKFGEMPFFNGGDFNTVWYEPAYRFMVDSGMTDARDAAEITAARHTVCNQSRYDKDFKIHLLHNPDNSVSYDHVLVDLRDMAIVRQYHLAEDVICSVASDHLPQIIDVDFIKK